MHGIAGLGPSPRANGVLRLWIEGASHHVQRGIASSAPTRKRGRSLLGDGYWELGVEGALVDDGCRGKVIRNARGREFSSLVKKVDIMLDKRQGKGLELTWIPSLEQVHGLILRRLYRQGASQCQVRFAVTLSGTPRRFKLSPVLTRVTRMCHDISKGQIIAAITRYVDRLQLRDPKDCRVIKCDPILQACFNVKAFCFSHLDTMLIPHLSDPDPVIIDNIISNADDSVGVETRTLDSNVHVRLRTTNHEHRRGASCPNVELSLADAVVGHSGR